MLTATFAYGVSSVNVCALFVRDSDGLVWNPNAEGGPAYLALASVALYGEYGAAIAAGQIGETGVYSAAAATTDTSSHSVYWFDSATPAWPGWLAIGSVASVASDVWTNTTRTLTGTGGAIGPTAGISLADISFRCHPGQTLPMAGQVYDGSGQYATIGETASIAYTVTDCESGESVAGMVGVSLTPASVLYDTLQSSAVASNYNLLFSWTAPAKRGTYLVALTFTGTTGTTWEAYFRGQVEW